MASRIAESDADELCVTRLSLARLSDRFSRWGSSYVIEAPHLEDRLTATVRLQLDFMSCLPSPTLLPHPCRPRSFHL